MMDYRGIEQEQRVPKFIRNGKGCEVVANDGGIKVVLSSTTSFTGEMEHELFSAIYYIKEGTGWEKSNMTKPYNSMEDFLNDIGSTEEFSEAYADYKEDND